MKSFYDSGRSIRCPVPAPSVSFGVGEWMVIARQSSWGKGAITEEETRRGRKGTPVVRCSWFVVRTANPSNEQRTTNNEQPEGGYA